MDYPVTGMASDQAYELRHVVQRFFRCFGALSAEVTPCGKPLSMAHAHALMLLLGQPELSQQELGRELNIDKSNVARLCAKLVESGHARQRPSEHDGRSRRVSLTTEGRRLAREVDASSHARFAAVLAGLARARRRELIDSLQQLLAAVEASVGPSAAGSLSEVVR
jgi:DNA-binding MarR family transcriptional regulator